MRVTAERRLSNGMQDKCVTRSGECCSLGELDVLRRVTEGGKHQEEEQKQKEAKCYSGNRDVPD